MDRSGGAVKHEPPDDERNLVRARRVRLPSRQLGDMILQYAVTVAVAQQRLEHDAQG